MARRADVIRWTQVFHLHLLLLRNDSKHCTTSQRTIFSILLLYLPCQQKNMNKYKAHQIGGRIRYATPSISIIITRLVAPLSESVT